MGQPSKRSSRRSSSSGSGGGPNDSDGALGIRNLLPGGRLGDYELGELLGKGAMGRVFRAHDPAGRDVAIKVMTDKADEEDAARFQLEGEALAAIPPHRNVVRVHTMGTVYGRPYLVMDLIEGESLQQRLATSGPFRLLEAAALGEKLCEALEHIHQAGVLHRDLKPANILLGPGDEPVVTDFGMASLGGARRLTLSGSLYGTPAVMAPEQILGKAGEVDGRSDVWALGVLLYQLISGELPFYASNLTRLAEQVTREDHPPLREHRPDVDPELAQIADRALAKRKTDRFATPGHMARALRLWRVTNLESAELEQELPSRRQLPWRTLGLAAGAVLVVALCGAGWTWWSYRQKELARGVLGERQTRLTAEARGLIPNLLGRGERWVRPSKIDRLASKLDDLQSEALEAGLPLDLHRARRALAYLRFEHALRLGLPEQVAELLEQLPPDEEVGRLVRARLALSRGETRTDELESLVGSSQPQVAEAGRVLLAQAVAGEDPGRARSLLATGVDPDLTGTEIAYLDLLMAIHSDAPSEATYREALSAIKSLDDSGVLGRVRLESLARCAELADARPWAPDPVLVQLKILAELQPRTLDEEAQHTAQVGRLIDELLLEAIASAPKVGPELGIQLLDHAGAARLRGLSYAVGTLLFDRVTKAVTFRDLAADQYLVAVEALIELDVPLLVPALRRMPEPHGRGAALDYLHQLWRLGNVGTYDDDLGRDDTRSQAEEDRDDKLEDAQTVRLSTQLREKLIGEWEHKLGPRIRASGLIASLHDDQDHDVAADVIERAFELDPENPTVVLHMAQLVGIQGDPERCDDLAMRAMEAFLADASRRDLLGYTLLPRIIEDVVELQARYGNPKAALELIERAAREDRMSKKDIQELREDLEKYSARRGS